MPRRKYIYALLFYLYYSDLFFTKKKNKIFVFRIEIQNFIFLEGAKFILTGKNKFILLLFLHSQDLINVISMIQILLFNKPFYINKNYII